MKKLLVFVCILLVPGGLFAEPENNSKGQRNEAMTMEEVVVSVTRMETTVDKIGGNSVSVITAEDIESKKLHSVEEILKTVPGVDIASNGGAGTRTAVFMRGADSKNTLVLIDGIMMNDPSQANRGSNLANITLDNVERIEVVRGAMSVMYGSNATAGVINIITKKGRRDPSLNASVEGGSYGSWKLNGGTSGATDKLDYSLSASYLNLEGYSTADADNEDIPQAGNTDEEDGYKNTTLSGKVGFDVLNNFKISGVIRYIDSEVELDDYASGYVGDNIGSAWTEDPPGSGNWVQTVSPFPDGPIEKKTESDQTFAKVTINNSLFKGLFDSILSYGFSNQERRSYDNEGEDDYDYKGNTDEFVWQGNFNFKTHTLSVGLTSLEEAMESESSGSGNQSVKTVSGWAQSQLFIADALDIVCGIRLDDHEEFGQKTTFRFAPAYDIEKTGTTIKASYGTGFRSPSLFELFSSYGNPDLEAEESKGFDIGFIQRVIDDKVKLGSTYFNMIYDDRIDYDMAISRYNQLPGETKTSGFESFIGWVPMDGLEFLLNHTLTKTEDPNGEKLERRPDNKFLLNSCYKFLEKGKINLDIFWVDERKASKYAMDGAGNSVEKLDSYMLVNTSVSYDISDLCQVYGRIDNLFDQYYEEAWSYATPGLSAYVGIKVRY